MEKTRGFEAGGIRYRLLRFPCLWTLGNIFIFGRWTKRNAELCERLLPPLEVLDAIQICPLLGPTGQFGFDAVWYGLMHRRQRSLHGEIRVEALAVHVYETVLLLAILLTFIYWMWICVHRCIKSLNNIPPLCGTCQNDANLYCNYLKRQKRLNHVQVHFSFCSLSDDYQVSAPHKMAVVVSKLLKSWKIPHHRTCNCSHNFTFLLPEHCEQMLIHLMCLFNVTSFKRVF